MRILSLLIILIASLPIFSQKIQLENSLSFFNTLIDCTSEAQMIEKCNFYQFKDQGIQDGFYVYEAPDGNIIRFKMEGPNSKDQTPVVETITKAKKKEIEKILLSLGYKKDGSDYIKGHDYSKSRRVCTLSQNKATKNYTFIAYTQYFRI